MDDVETWQNDPKWFWDVTGPREYLNIPTPVPDHWRAAITFGKFPSYKTVVAWGPTEAKARIAAASQIPSPPAQETESK